MSVIVHTMPDIASRTRMVLDRLAFEQARSRCPHASCSHRCLSPCTRSTRACKIGTCISALTLCMDFYHASTEVILKITAWRDRQRSDWHATLRPNESNLLCAALPFTAPKLAQDPDAFCAAAEEEQTALRARLTAATERLTQVRAGSTLGRVLGPGQVQQRMVQQRMHLSVAAERLAQVRAGPTPDGTLGLHVRIESGLAARPPHEGRRAHAQVHASLSDVPSLNLDTCYRPMLCCGDQRWLGPCFNTPQ